MSYILALLCERVIHIPRWAKLGICFPNALSLPLLLLNSLEETHVIKQLLWDEQDTVAEAVRRGKTYILVCSLPWTKLSPFEV
jgi:hypothetical protein